MKHLRPIIISAMILSSCLALPHIAGAAHAPAARARYRPAADLTLDSLKLREADLPTDAVFSKKDYIKSIQAATLYDDPSTYSFILGEVQNKDAQSIEGPGGDNGTMLYFIFKKPVNGKEFIEALIWGDPPAPTMEHPEEILIKGNIMVIVSFNKGSHVGKALKTLMMKRMGL